MQAKSLTDCVQDEARALGVTLDADQQRACQTLQAVYAHHFGSAPGRFVARALHPFRSALPGSGAFQGGYLYGGVGRGKSLVMNTFFSCVPLARKRRVHFYAFMQDVHARLALLKGRQNPLRLVAREMAREARLLCLDEFHVTDITDAMLINGLLQGFFARGVMVVMTSNSAPDDLYCNGLQRARFLPTIALLKERMALVSFDGDVDYRRQFDTMPSGDLALPKAFRSMADGDERRAVPLEVQGRLIMARCLVGDMAWFDFHDLCTAARGKADYIELAIRFRTICLSGLVRFDRLSVAQARRFMWLVDEFYDRGVRLIFPDAAPLAFEGRADLLDGEFQRVLSRLVEMQSSTYLYERSD